MKTLFVSICCGLTLQLCAQQTNLLPSTGNVGLGTTTPSAKLDVNGRVVVDSSLLVKDSVRVQKNMRIEQDLKVDGKIVMFQNSVAKEDFRIDGTLRLPNATPLNSNNLNSNNFRLLLLNENGGTRTGTMGDLSSQFLKQTYGGSTCGIIGDDANGTLYQSPIWKSVPVSQSFGYLITGIDCPARVGIGIATPQAPLHVAGSGIITGNVGIGDSPLANTQINVVTNRRHGIQINHNYLANNGSAITVSVNNISSKGLSVHNANYIKDVFQVFGDGKVIVSSSVNDILTIEPTGKFTISNAQNKILQLDENGLLHARKIRVDEEVWPDYVFKSDYDLMPLSAVENFILKNGHLPKVPSEKTILENGVDLGEMNRILLEKVEELTLYSIEQEKKLADLQNEINQLKKSEP